MTVQIAIRTISAIDGVIEREQGSSYRGWLGKVIPHIGDAYRTDDDPFRPHLGASLLGASCGRSIWYSFRWATRPKFSGRMMRLFNRGHMEEARFIAMFLMIGCQVFQQDENGKQYRISGSEGHFGGSGDGIMLGIPDLPPGTYALSEFKTHSEKSFIDLAGKNWRDYIEGQIGVPGKPRAPFTGKGVRESKFEHYVQMCLYMHKMKLPFAIYCAVNKNTDDIYMEIISANPEVAEQFLERGDKIIWMREAPSKINNSPGWYECKFCDHYPVCHMGKAPDVNCRTCGYSLPIKGGHGVWACTNPVVTNGGDLAPLDRKTQFNGCSHYERSEEF